MALCTLSCTAISTETIKDSRSSGVSRSYDRSPDELYEAGLAAVKSLSTGGVWSGLKVTQAEPAEHEIVAEQHLDSSVIPGVGVKNGLGIFVADEPGGGSAVTVVTMAADQFPGSGGTMVDSYRNADTYVFPAIDDALAAIPVRPKPVVAAAAAPRPVRTAPASSAGRPAPSSSAPAGERAAPPAAPALRSTSPAPATSSGGGAASAPAAGSPVLDRAYDVLRGSGSWRPLVREVRADGTEEIRVGHWATLRASGERLVLLLQEGAGSPSDAARLALDLSTAGFDVDVETAPRERRAH